ncbi:MAG: hypothetical protein QOD99_2877 [Chthoniobacter sp.]|jgi:flavin-dependent dehydrogenase|nr:hypothetical protein [Chthoniobacter sp.]
MAESYDVAIIGGAFSGAATGLLLKRSRPELRVLIVEKAAEFDRKVGESTTEVSSCFMTRVLGLSTYLGHEQLAKQGLRMWFSNDPEQAFEDCVEFGARYNSRLSGFQVDRAKLDEHLLQCAVKEGCEIHRPAKVLECELNGIGANALRLQRGAEAVSVTAKWVVDASGRAALLARKLGHFKPLTEHPINAMWGRFTDVRDWDGAGMAKNFPRYASACRTSRSWATNHLCGLGWWCWIIPLKGGDYSIGLVYDQRLYTPPASGSIAERLRAHFMAHPVGREILGEAKPVEHDMRAFSMLPYFSEKIVGDGWAIVGDAAGFIDPLYSPGLDFCSFTSKGISSLILRSLAGEEITAAAGKYNDDYRFCFRAWFEAIYRDKYYYLGDAELMAAAFLLDVSSYHLGPVRQVYSDPATQFEAFPFEGIPGRVARRMLMFYNRRLSVLARKKIEAGTYGDRNSSWRLLVGGFVPDASLVKLLRQGLFRWWRAEVRALFLRRPPQPLPEAKPARAAS